MQIVVVFYAYTLILCEVLLVLQTTHSFVFCIVFLKQFGSQPTKDRNV